MRRKNNLFIDIINFDNCYNAILEASVGCGRAKKFIVQKIVNEDSIDFYANDLSNRLKNMDFITPYFHKTIKDGLSKKEREIEIPKFYPDQCAHHAIIRVIMPYILNSSYYWSCANIPKRGIDKASKGIERATKRDIDNAIYCLKGDIKKFYPSISHDILKQKIRKKFKDKYLIQALDILIDSHEQGIPLGNYTSPWFAELYLQSLDFFIKQQCKIKHYVRYADDIVLIDNNKEKLHKVLNDLKDYLKNELDLELKNNYQIFLIYDNKKGRKIDFVGKCFGRGFTTIRKRRALAFIRTSKKLDKKLKNKEYLPPKLAASFVSRSNCLNHVNAYALRKKYYCNINLYQVKKVLREQNKKEIESIIKTIKLRAQLKKN